MVKNRCLWAFWLLGVGFLYLFKNDTEARIILIASFLIPTLLIIFAGIAVKKVDASLEVPEVCGKGISLGGKILIYNGSILPALRVSCTIKCQNMLTGERKEEKLSIILMTKGEKCLPFDAGSDYCGKLRISIADCRLRDMFGLSAWKLKPPPEKTVVVVAETFEPQITIVENVNAIIDSDIYSMTKPGSDPSETFAIREYVPGDSIKSIHWKLSQKSESLMVREYGFPIINQILLLFEASCLGEYGIPAPKQIDAMAEAFLSISVALAKQGISHTIGWKHSDSGLFISHEIRFVEELDAVTEEFLSNTVMADQLTTIGCYRKFYDQCAYSHVAIVSSYVEPDNDMIFNGNRITVLRCVVNSTEDGVCPAGIQQVLFSGSHYREELGRLEL